MEFKIDDYQLPSELTFNYDEIKKELTEKVKIYKTLVYSEEQVKEAKADRATLNKFKNALNDERLKREKEYMKPFNEFKAKVNELIKIIDEPIALIDKQVKEFDEHKKEEKLEEITNFFNSTLHHEWVKLPMIFDDKWLNASCSMKSIQTAIDAKLEQIEKDLNTLANLPEFGFEAQEVYKSTLDMNKAIYEAQNMARIAKAKAEAEAKKAEYERTQAAKLAEQMAVEEQATVSKKEQVEPQPTVKKSWIRLAANMTLDQAKELKKFFEDRNIEFKSI